MASLSLSKRMESAIYIPLPSPSGKPLADEVSGAWGKRSQAPPLRLGRSIQVKYKPFGFATRILDMDSRLKAQI